MKKMILLMALLSMGSAYAGTGFNYGKHNRKSNRVRIMNKLFNMNRCRGYHYKTGL
jgi:hypothetical protein